MRKEVGEIQSGNAKLVDGSLELERMVGVLENRCRELEACVGVLMKFPDATLGDAVGGGLFHPFCFFFLEGIRVVLHVHSF